MKKELTLNANACQGQSTTSMADMAAKIAQRLLAPAANYYSRVLGTKVSIRQVLLLINAQAAFVMAGVLLMGFTYPATSHISVLYRNEGFSPAHVSLLVSAMGAALFVGKCVYGQAADKLGNFRSGNIFFGMLVIGSALCCLAGNGNMGLAVAAVVLVSCGSVLLSVGLTIIADAVAKKQYYAVVVRRIQIIYMLGSMVFGVVPGIIADHVGNYIPAYVLITVFAAAAALLIQPILYKRSRQQ